MGDAVGAGLRCSSTQSRAQIWGLLTLPHFRHGRGDSSLGWTHLPQLSSPRIDSELRIPTLVTCFEYIKIQTYPSTAGCSPRDPHGCFSGTRCSHSALTLERSFDKFAIKNHPQNKLPKSKAALEGLAGGL